MGYLLDSFKIKKDIDYINEHIKTEPKKIHSRYKGCFCYIIMVKDFFVEKMGERL